MASFLRRLISKFSPARDGERVSLAAFGKHPGWDDHIDDLGLDTDRLVELKRLLYLQGIAGNIDSGAWENLDNQQQSVPFRHTFLWRPDGAGGDALLGKLWASRDGKGRSRYPMVVCAHCRDLPLEWVLTRALPQLDQVEAACAATTHASEVRSIMDQARAALRAAAATAAPAHPDHRARAVSYLASRPEMGQGGRGLVSVVYRIEEEMGPYVPRSSRTDSHMLPVRPAHLRVPACADTPAAVLRVWSDFLPALLDPATPLMLFVATTPPPGEGWVDVIAGDPNTSNFYAVRASPKALPLTTQIPYTIDDQVVRRVERFIADHSANGRPPVSAAP